MNDEQNIFGIIRKAETDYMAGNTKISEYVNFSLKENVNKIEAYLNSKHISGQFDSQGRRKPFFNIVTSAVNIWYRATKLHRANIRVRATNNAGVIPAIFYNAILQNWMKETDEDGNNFGTFLVKWGMTQAKYGSAITKFVERGDTLVASVEPWNRTIIDSIDFKKAPVIVKLELTPAELKKNKLYDQKVVEQIMDSVSTRKTLNKESQDNKNDFIEVYEVHGELPLSLYKIAKGIEPLDEDDDIFIQQIHHVSYLGSGNEGDGYENFTLYCGKEKDPYLMTHLLEEEGRSQSIGAVEHLFESQWMVNHTEKNIKDQLDLASKLMFQTADDTFIGRNVLTDIANGFIAIHKPNMPITAMQNNSHDISALQSSRQAWQGNGMDVTNTPDAQRGNNQPANTPALLVQQLVQQSQSLFEEMTVNRGLSIEQMMRKFILPFIDKRLNKMGKDELSAILENEGIKQIDSMYVPNQAIINYNKGVKEAILAGKIPPQFTPEVQAQHEQAVTKGLQQLGNQRFFAPGDVSWKELFADFDKNCEVEVTNESHDKQALLASLGTVMTSLVQMGDIANARLILGKIMEASGVMNSSELSQIQSAPMPTQPMPTSPTPQPPTLPGSMAGGG